VNMAQFEGLLAEYGHARSANVPTVRYATPKILCYRPLCCTILG